MTTGVSGVATTGKAPDMFDFDFILKKTNYRWKIKTDRGMTVAYKTSNSSIEDLVNAVANTTTPKVITINGGGSYFNINGPLRINSDTVLIGAGMEPMSGFNLETNGNCNMLEPYGGTGADNIADVMLWNLKFDANKGIQGGAGPYSCIAWELGEVNAGNWKLLHMDNVHCTDAKGHVISLKTLTGGATGAAAQVILHNVKAYSPAYNYYGLNTDRIFDSKFHHLILQNFRAQNSFASNVMTDVYMSGGDTNIPNFHLTNSMNTKSIFHNIRSDWCDDHGFLIDNADNNSFGLLQVTQCKDVDDTFTALRFEGSAQHNQVGQLIVEHDASRSVNAWKYGVEFVETSMYNQIGLVKVDEGAVATAEVSDLYANRNEVLMVTRENGLAGRLIYG